VAEEAFTEALPLPYLVCDARYEHVRDDGRIENEAVLVVMGVDEEGYREILSVAVVPTEEEASWGEALDDLLERERGVDPETVRLVVSDHHRGLRAALARYLPRAQWQWCQVHYQRAAGAKVPCKARAEVHAGLRDVFQAPDRATALRRAQEWQKEEVEEAVPGAGEVARGDDRVGLDGL